jgi:membrane associated rhomboid family serine protease
VTFGYPAEETTDPSVCYRHPDRQSWILCQRCGRTICPECQIQAPVGVQCPECVREAGGSVRWTPTVIQGGAARGSSTRRSPAWVRRLGSMLKPEGGAPALSWGIAAAAVLFWVVGWFTGLPYALLAALPQVPWQVWRLVTGIVAYPPGFGLTTLIFFALSMVFWFLNAPGAEKTMGRPRFAAIVLTATIVGNAAMMLFGLPGYGIGAALFGIFAAYLIAAWDYPPARNQILIMLGINLLINLLLGGFGIPAILGGAIAGAGAEFLLRWFAQNRRNVSPATPYLIVFGAAIAIAAIAVIRLIAAPVGLG